MQQLLCALAGLALLRAGAGELSQAPRDTPGQREPSTAESPSSPGEDPAWSPGCDRHMAVQSRLDIMEETVEKTVEHLEAEVTGLLGLLQELASNLPPGPFSPKPDLLGDEKVSDYQGWWSLSAEIVPLRTKPDLPAFLPLLCVK
ncbi:Placenta-specific protein 9 [Apodemus speciosus]|uniref:Placenta-specific protein 9 n=1 Tax=Apodemus speciosus TaxID=105296 RepID=A0ABQ0FHE1_APOSI